MRYDFIDNTSDEEDLQGTGYNIVSSNIVNSDVIVVNDLSVDRSVKQ